MKNEKNQSIPSLEAQKVYTKLEAERIRSEIARFGSEGLCSHCTHKDVCMSSTTTVRLGSSRIECNGYNITVDGTKKYMTKMKYSFEYDEGRKRIWEIEGIDENRRDFKTIIEAKTASAAERKLIDEGIDGRKVYAIFEGVQEVKQMNEEPKKIRMREMKQNTVVNILTLYGVVLIALLATIELLPSWFSLFSGNILPYALLCASYPILAIILTLYSSRYS